MDGVILEGVDVWGVDFELVCLIYVNFCNVCLEGFFGINIKFGEVDIEGVDLMDIILWFDMEDYFCGLVKGINLVIG